MRWKHVGTGVAVILVGAWAGLLVPRLLDDAPPVVDLSLPAGPLRGEVVLTTAWEDPGTGVGGVRLTLDGEPVDPEAGNLDTRGLADGEHLLELLVWDRALPRGSTRVARRFTTDNTPPALTVEPLRGSQGRTLSVWVDGDEPLVGPTVHLLGRTLPLHPVQGRWRALVGVGIEAEPGEHLATLRAADAVGNEVVEEAALQVGATEFLQRGRVRLTAAQARARRDEAARVAVRAERDAAYAHREPYQLWEGPFDLPLERPSVTSPFGAFRAYSDGTRSHHTGVDLGRRRGTPVRAPAAGVVLLAHPQAIHGNAIIVHHGQGVATAYSHLDRIDVEEGQAVSRGEVLGLLGTTGQSTGPHLHWTVVVAGEAVDPMEWVQEGF